MKSAFTATLTQKVLSNLVDLLHGPSISDSDASLCMVVLQRPDLALEPGLPTVDNLARVYSCLLQLFLLSLLFLLSFSTFTSFWNALEIGFPEEENKFRS